MKIGSLFSGIGGLELGLEWAGLGPVTWQVEIDPFCRGVLATHWPDVERFEDVRTVGKTNLVPVDLICGGFPCQDVSVAGKGAGLGGKRSGLWTEFARIVSELRPTWIVVENVASGRRRWLERVRLDLRSLGYDSIAVALSAFDVGAPHRRERVFIVADCDRSRLERHLAKPVTECAPALRSDPLVPNTDGEGEFRGASGDGAQWLWSRDGCRARWTIVPPVCGVAHGVPRRLDRLRSLGNAVVPQCAQAIGRFLVEVAS